METENSEGAERTGADITDDGLDDLIEAMRRMKKPEHLEGKTFEQQLEELDNHPAFMKEWDPSKPLSDEMEGLMRLKYESEDPTAKAEAYKEDGNHEFQKKKYRIAIDNYTEGIKCLCPDKQLNAVLYTNRAAAQFHLENYRTALNDCIFARKFKPDHFKAIHRGAMCNLQMKKYEDCLNWCDEALIIDPKNEKILEIRQKATKLQKAVERDKRKEKATEKKDLSKDLKLIQTIQQRGITLNKINKMVTGEEDLSPALLESVETHNPHGAKVHLDANNILYWPVMFLYPEYTETDYIQMFCENQRIIDHLSHIFGVEAEPAPWDQDRRYKPHTINVYFEDRDKEVLHKVNKESTLLKVLQHKRFVVYGGTPAFILTVAGSEFEKAFLEKYKD
ncbi:tetratricopeptide repeat protein 4-like [Mercenaria mercenaria]|uniref:tetratricopeptide repeat protein 4-like n=1 Tax=Mercenaria mercenaria TaxID=6596 RepID=UPI00234E40F0|nr:tetratricopeptide repeat protein 4-like [Mercenaria mercenaria]XP_045158939.2 tetratricopeptide repeat protein 4-like [Mercenaria mercenaria]XP_045158940.2 tetratricopeptide repeat protein 4-like [Mercenaria mercenaria]XP_045158941.2 tetratricopeptide repeat protein 4-like [Mercenaria mercenaria]